MVNYAVQPQEVNRDFLRNSGLVTMLHWDRTARIPHEHVPSYLEFFGFQPGDALMKVHATHLSAPFVWYGTDKAEVKNGS
jgi:hypothetical protein